MFLNLLTATKPRQFCLFSSTGEDFPFRRSLELWTAQVQRPQWKFRRLQGLEQNHVSLWPHGASLPWEWTVLMSPELLDHGDPSAHSVHPISPSDQACHTKEHVHSSCLQKWTGSKTAGSHMYQRTDWHMMHSAREDDKSSPSESLEM